MQHPELQWTPELAAKFWSYESRFPERYFTYPYGDEVFRKLRPYLSGRDTILDYGCGAGHFLEKLLAHGYRAAGVDFSQKSVASVRNRFAARENFLGAFNPDDLGRVGRRFAAITVIEVIEHLYDDALDALLMSVRQLLNRDGIIIFTTPNEEQLEEAYVLCPCCEKVFHRWQHVRSWSQTDLRRYLEGKGFDIVDSFTTDFNRKRRRKLKNWRLVKRCRALWLRWAKRVEPRIKEPHLAIVCRPSVPED